MQGEVGKRNVEGRVLWIGIALTYLLMLRGEELFGRGSGKVHEVPCLKRGDVARTWWR